MPDFSINISELEKKYLQDLVRYSLLYYFNKGTLPEAEEVPKPPQNSCLQREYGAFVTFTKGGHLRGCIGHLIGDGPLYLTVAKMAQAAAFHDHRFPPLSSEELDEVDFEISIMSSIEPCPDTTQIEIGKHGLIIQRGNSQGVLLPQVPLNYGWDVPTFLQQLCRKAGLAPDAWNLPDTNIFWFKCVIVEF